jgi:tetratricopeptide (TPR) repeat protein
MNNKVKIGIAAVVVIFLALAGFVWYKNSHKPAPVSQHPITITPDQKTRLENEIADYKNKIAASKDDSEKMGLYLAIGIDYEGLGQFDQAKSSFLKGVELQPMSYLPWTDLASLYETLGDYNQEKQALQKALSLGNGEMLNWQKWIEFNRYKLQAGESEIRKLYSDAFTATQDNFQLHREYAAYLEEIKAYKDELREWKFLLSINSSDTTAKAEVARLEKLVK